MRLKEISCLSFLLILVGVKMTGCYSFLLRNRRRNSQAHVACDDIVFYPRGHRKPDSLTFDWLSRSPLPRTAFDLKKMSLPVSEWKSQQCERHIEKIGSSLNVRIVNKGKENKYSVQRENVTFKQKHQKESPSLITDKPKQKQNVKKETLQCNRKRSPSSTEVSSNQNILHCKSAETLYVRRPPENRIERLFFKPVSVTYSSCEVRPIQVAYIGSAKSTDSLDNPKRLPLLSESFDNEKSKTFFDQSHMKKSVPKVKVLRMTSTPVPHSTSIQHLHLQKFYATKECSKRISSAQIGRYYLHEPKQ